jgi:hypothetical protein
VLLILGALVTRSGDQEPIVIQDPRQIVLFDKGSLCPTTDSVGDPTHPPNTQLVVPARQRTPVERNGELAPLTRRPGPAKLGSLDIVVRHGGKTLACYLL